MNENSFDWQGHRGCRGLMPENTIPAFLKALEYPVTTLELDLAVSKDNKLIISHEPWMSHHICSNAKGESMTKQEAQNTKIMELTYEEIKTFDCGSKGNTRFPDQEKMTAFKPSLEELVLELKKYCLMRKMELPAFNIEIKSQPDWDDSYTPPPSVFAKLVIDEITNLGILDQTCIQSFDVRPLREIKKQAPHITIALLVENLNSVDANLQELGFKPDIYSPYYKILRKKHIKYLHKQGIKVIPWTVNKIKTMKKLRRKGVDGIITDYPNLIEEVE